MDRTYLILASLLALIALPGAGMGQDASLMQRAMAFVITDETPVKADPSNRFANDPLARQLGEALFFDAGLSEDGTVACATCHVTDGAMIPNESKPAGASRGFRTVMPVLGAVNQSFFFWDGRVDSLWSQALGPLENPDEHGLTRTEVVARALTDYLDDIETLAGNTIASAEQLKTLPPASPLGNREERKAWAALPPEAQAQVNDLFVLVGKAIAAYEASLPLPDGEWDRLILAAKGDAAKVPAVILRGFDLFAGKARCATCHFGPLFSDYDFHNTGLPAREGQPVDLGRQVVLMTLERDEFNCLGPHSDAGPEDCKDLRYMSRSMERAFGTFRTPSLRDVGSRTALGHAGQMATLDDMLRHYNAAPPGPHGAMVGVYSLSELVPLDLTEAELADLKAFLLSL